MSYIEKKTPFIKGFLAAGLLWIFVGWGYSIYHSKQKTYKIQQLEQRIESDSILIDKLKHPNHGR